LYISLDYLPIHSSPTRRSSDLVKSIVGLPLVYQLFSILRIIFLALTLTIRTCLTGIFGPFVHFHSNPFKRLYNVRLSILHIPTLDRKSTRLNSSHVSISYAVFC